MQQYTKCMGQYFTSRTSMKKSNISGVQGLWAHCWGRSEWLHSSAAALLC